MRVSPGCKGSKPNGPLSSGKMKSAQSQGSARAQTALRKLSVLNSGSMPRNIAAEKRKQKNSNEIKESRIAVKATASWRALLCLLRVQTDKTPHLHPRIHLCFRSRTKGKAWRRMQPFRHPKKPSRQSQRLYPGEAVVCR